LLEETTLQLLIIQLIHKRADDVHVNLCVHCLFRLCFDACVFAQHCFVFSMKQGTCVINFMLLNVLVGKLNRHFWVRKLVGHLYL
jgi:hypothetical protein